MYEHFEHTADLGFRITAKTLPELFEQAGLCLFAAIVERVEAIQPNLERQFSITGTEIDYLLFDWLRALLLAADEEKLVFGKFTVNLTHNGLTATAWGEPLDDERHLRSREVKAITYHELLVEEQAEGWLAEVIVDI